jgi:hypothetical protein
MLHIVMVISIATTHVYAYQMMERWTREGQITSAGRTIVNRKRRQYERLIWSDCLNPRAREQKTSTLLERSYHCRTELDSCTISTTNRF